MSILKQIFGPEYEQPGEPPLKRKAPKSALGGFIALKTLPTPLVISSIPRGSLYISQQVGDVIWVQTSTDGILAAAIQNIDCSRPGFAIVQLVKVEDYRDTFDEWQADELAKLNLRTQDLIGTEDAATWAGEIRRQYLQKSSRSKADVLFRNPETAKADYWIEHRHHLREGLWPRNFPHQVFENRKPLAQSLNLDCMD